MSRFLIAVVTMQKFCSSPWRDATEASGYSSGMTWALTLVQKRLDCSQRIYQLTVQGNTDSALSSCQPCQSFVTMSLYSKGTRPPREFNKGYRPALSPSNSPAGCKCEIENPALPPMMSHFGLLFSHIEENVMPDVTHVNMYICTNKWRR